MRRSLPWRSSRKVSRSAFARGLHMTLLLSAVSISGLFASKVLLGLGLRSMFVRYLIAVCVSYVVFFFLIRVLLWYLTGSARLKPRFSDPDTSDVTDPGQIAFDWIPRSVSAPGDALNGPSVEVGDFGGGGATDMWGDSPNASAPVYASASTPS